MVENKHITNIDGNIAKNTRNDIENSLYKSIITSSNNLNYKHPQTEKPRINLDFFVK